MTDDVGRATCYSGPEPGSYDLEALLRKKIAIEARQRELTLLLDSLRRHHDARRMARISPGPVRKETMKQARILQIADGSTVYGLA